MALRVKTGSEREGNMAKKSGDQRSNPDRRRTPRPEVSRRTIKRDEDSTQLLERGEGPR